MNLQEIKPGADVYYVNKTEGPGQITYVHGIALEAEGDSITLQVVGSGFLFAPGHSPLFRSTPEKGTILRFTSGPGRLVYTPEEFSTFKKSFESMASSIEPLEEKVPVFEEESEEEEKEPSREEIEEGSPSFDEDGGISKKASLSDASLMWPKGFSPKEQHWMEDIYNSLPEGASETTPAGEPIIMVPGDKGLGVPPDFSKSVKLKEEFEAVGAKVQEIAKNLKEAESSEKSQEEVDRLSTELSAEKDRYLDIQKQLAAVLQKSRPEGESFTAVPGRRGPTGQQFGKAGLLLELGELSNKYKEFQKLKTDIAEKADQTDRGREEINLLFNYGKEKLLGDNPEEAADALDKLQKLKFEELKDLPFFWDEGDRSDVLDMQKLVGATGKDAPATVFQEYMGKNAERSFFDLSPEELEILSKQIAETSPLSAEEVSRRAEKFSQDYKKFIEEQIGSESLSKSIQQYMQAEHDLTISDATASHLAKKALERGISVNVDGVNGEGKSSNVRVSSEELRKNVIQKFVKNFKNRILWLKRLQDGRKLNLAREKAHYKKDKDTVGDERVWKDSIVSTFLNYKKHAGVSEEIPNRYRLFHGYLPYKEKVKQLHDKQEEIKNLKSDMDKLKEGSPEEITALHDKMEKAEKEIYAIEEELGTRKV